MSNIIESRTVGPLTVRVEVDTDPSDPRECENLGTMACWHRRYKLGDKQPDYQPYDFHRRIAADQLGGITVEQMSNGKVDDYVRRNFIILPLRLYDHSGLGMSIGEGPDRNFYMGFDSGQVGWIYVHRSDAMKWFLAKRFTRQVRQRTIDALTAEVQSYHDYLSGNVFGYTVYDGDEILDSAWGYHTPASDAMTEGVASAEHILAHRAVDSVKQGMQVWR